ncbi:MAG: ATP-binding protein [Phycisphaerae bacterium]|jgi:predicted AAA+ superfamily ATPase|nr:ATP-binding protein [Phycisphaerae bacterium]
MLVARDLLSKLKDAGSRFPSITVNGPRQSGKSTLCRMAFPDLPHTNLESLEVRRSAIDDPVGFLDRFPRGAVLDEVQRAPELLSYLQVRIDEDRMRSHGIGPRSTAGASPSLRLWVLTGSFNFALLSTISQSLAGRTAVHQLLPLSWNEITQTTRVPATLDEAILAGGYPAPFDLGLAPSEWIESYVTTYIERDARELVAIHDLQQFHNFITLCAGRTSQLMNLTSLGGDTGVVQSTARAWLGILETLYITHRITPWFVNVGKRLVKSPKLHFIDTGIASWLMGIQSPEALRSHPLRGALFESWVAGEILKHRFHRGERRPIHFYRDSSGLEADILIDHGTHRTVAEAKAAKTVSEDALASTKRVASAIGNEFPARRVVIYGGDERQSRSDVDVVPWREIHSVDWV